MKCARCGKEMYEDMDSNRWICESSGCESIFSNMTPLSDSGIKETHDSGYHRDSRVGKGRYDLDPPRPTHLVACIFEDGGIKYGDRNWEKGAPVDRFLDSALRHINQYKAGLRVQPHLPQAIWNLKCGLEMAIRADDISKYERERLAKFEEEDK